MRAWTVRGGEHGEFESAALEKGLVALGWVEVPDISRVSSIEELTEVVRKTYAGSSPRSINNSTHQLWRFANVMKIDDLVVMPRKFKPVIAIGRLRGVYEYQPDAAAGYRHIRQVEWLNPAVERAAVRGDLRDSMGSLLTVSELRGRDAVGATAEMCRRLSIRSS